MLFALGAVSIRTGRPAIAVLVEVLLRPIIGLRRRRDEPVRSDRQHRARRAPCSRLRRQHRQLLADFAADHECADRGAKPVDERDGVRRRRADSTSLSDPLQDLFSQIDGNGDGQISKSEFENALGAGGTNMAQADNVFSKLDKNGDGNVSLDELKSALQGAGGHHGGIITPQARAMPSGRPAADRTSGDPLAQALRAHPRPRRPTRTARPRPR